MLKEYRASELKGYVLGAAEAVIPGGPVTSSTSDVTRAVGSVDSKELSTVVTTPIIAFVIWLVVRAASKLQHAFVPAAQAMKDIACRLTAIPTPGKRYRHCTLKLSY